MRTACGGRGIDETGWWRRRVIMLVKAGAPVDATIKGLLEYMEAGDIIIDGGNEWCVPALLWGDHSRLE